MFEVRDAALKKYAVIDPEERQISVDEAREEADKTALVLSTQDPDNPVFATMIRVTIVDKFPELRVVSIYDAEIKSAL